MTQKELKQTLKDKLKECDKDTLVDIIADFVLVYIGARALVDMSGANCMQQPLTNIQTNIQEINSCISQIIDNNMIK